MAAVRFALTDGGALRAARWFGRVLSLAALWPVRYALFGKIGFDWEAMLFGGPALLLGLVAWGWSGYRLRNPRAHVEIDRQAGVARLRRGDDEPAIECRLDALGEWALERWTTTSVNKGARTTTNWVGVTCPGFPGQRLFVGLDPAECRRWCVAVDAAARPFAGDWSFSEPALAAVLARHGLHDRDELLWTATGLVDERARELDAATLEAAAVKLTQTTIGERLGARFDALVDGSRGAVATIGLIVLTGAFAFAAARLLAQTQRGAGEQAVLLAIALFLLTLGWRASRGPIVAAAFAAVVGAAFVSKPWVAPVVSEFMGERHVLSPTSETHLYYVLPGIGLIVVALALLSTMKVRKPVAPPRASGRGDAIRLDPPRPDPPKPG